MEQQQITYADFLGPGSTTVNDEYGLHTIYAKKYGYNFYRALRDFNTETIETLSLPDNSFLSLTESQARSLEGVKITSPSNISYESESNTSWTTTGQLNNYPVCQSEFFAIFGYNGSANDIKLTRVSGVPSSNGQYNISWSDGKLNFYNNQNSGSGNDAVYYYGGSITVSESHNLSNIYHYVQANYSDIFTAQTETAFTSYVDILVGNSTDEGLINETSDRTLNIEDGYGFSAGSANGTTINILSDTWNFNWYSDNGTFFRKYSLDIIVKNSIGETLEDANVTLKDTNSNVIFSINTSSDGTVPQQEVTYALYNYTGNQTFSPFTVTVTRNGYTDYSAPMDLNRKTISEIVMTAPCDPDLNYTYEVFSGNNTNTNRSENAQNLTMEVLVKYGNGTEVEEGKSVDLYITKSGTGGGATWDSGRRLYANSSGYINYSFFPTCDDAGTSDENEEYEVGQHNWYATVQDTQLCQDYPSENYIFNVTGTLSNIIVFPDGSQNYSSTDTILLQVYVENYCAEAITTDTSNI
jgi:hypothetical protein